MTLTTFNEDFWKIIEPNVSTTRERFEVLKTMRDNNIPTVVWIAPILPFINDSEENLRGIINYCIEAKVYGIICFGIGMTLRDGNREYYYENLDKHFQGLKEKYINSFRYDYEVKSKNSKNLIKILKEECKKNNIILNNDEIFKYLYQFPNKEIQLGFFD